VVAAGTVSTLLPADISSSIACAALASSLDKVMTRRTEIGQL
jgi:hypothetical protein